MYDVTAVRVIADYFLLLIFNGTEKRIFDFKSYASSKSGLAADILNDSVLFKTVKLDGTGTICWSNDYDIAQEYLYSHSVPS